MSFPVNPELPDRVPQRLPVGSSYVVEGFGGEDGNLRVIARYLLLPNGRRINVPAELSKLAPELSKPARPARRRTLAVRRKSHTKRSDAKSGSATQRKKFARRRGTA